ncbi:MAG: hypothetical protein QOJ16_1341, partial [Acidobacteriota bacterium]|nr:hypothetical protein [Acidobacteriota bacterium]
MGEESHEVAIEIDRFDELPLGHPLLGGMGDVDAPRPEEEGL